MPVVAAADVERAFDLGHDRYAFWVFTVPMIVASLIEAPIAALSDRAARDRMLGCGLAVLGAALLGAAFANAPWQLAITTAVAGAASGVACASAQGTLVVTAKDGADGAMARWAAAGALGDALAPVVVHVAITRSGSYRGALGAIALASLVAAGVTLRARVGGAQPEDDEETPTPAREALGRPRLWLFLLGVTACGLLDEIVVAVVALRMTQDLHAATEVTSFALAACSAGAVIGAWLTPLALRHATSRAVLVASALLTAIAIVVVCAASSPVLLVPSLFALGLAVAPHYPLLMAAAFDVVPDRPGLVHALANVLVVVDVVLPLLVGVIAARFGLVPALLALTAQPACVLALAGLVRATDDQPR